MPFEPISNCLSSGPYLKNRCTSPLNLISSVYLWATFLQVALGTDYELTFGKMLVSCYLCSSEFVPSRRPGVPHPYVQ